MILARSCTSGHGAVAHLTAPVAGWAGSKQVRRGRRAVIIVDRYLNQRRISIASSVIDDGIAKTGIPVDIRIGGIVTGSRVGYRLSVFHGKRNGEVMRWPGVVRTEAG